MKLSPNLSGPMGNGISAGAVNAALQQPFPVQQQKMTNWCWAACTSAVCAFYQDATQPSQEQLVAQELQMPVCNSTPLLPPCNKIFDFGQALDDVGHFVPPVLNKIDPASIAQSISNNQPVGFQLNIPGIGGHAVVVITASQDGSGKWYVTVADPSDGSCPVMSWDEFGSNYRMTGGYWERAYTIKP